MSFMRDRLTFEDSSLASERRRLVLNLVIPAASSMMARRSVGFELQDLADAALLDDGVGIRAQPDAHEQILDVAQARHAAIDEIFALPGAIQAPANDDLARFQIHPMLFRAALFLEHLTGAEPCSAIPLSELSAGRSEGLRSMILARDCPRLRWRRPAHSPTCVAIWHLQPGADVCTAPSQAPTAPLRPVCGRRA